MGDKAKAAIFATVGTMAVGALITAGAVLATIVANATQYGV